MAYVPVEVTAENIGTAIQLNINLILKEIGKKMQAQAGQAAYTDIEVSGVAVRQVAYPLTKKSAVNVAALTLLTKS